MVKNIDLIGENTGKIRGKIYNLYHIKELYLSLINAHTDEEYSYISLIFHRLNALFISGFIAGKASYPHNRISYLQVNTGKNYG